MRRTTQHLSIYSLNDFQGSDTESSVQDSVTRDDNFSLISNSNCPKEGQQIYELKQRIYSMINGQRTIHQVFSKLGEKSELWTLQYEGQELKLNSVQMDQYFETGKINYFSKIKREKESNFFVFSDLLIDYVSKINKYNYIELRNNNQKKRKQSFDFWFEKDKKLCLELENDFDSEEEFLVTRERSLTVLNKQLSMNQI